jgi:hypothetical protein
VRILLDENFPLGLERHLKNDGYEVEHVITIGWRGASDDRIRQRLVDPEILFLTHDQEFLFSSGPAAIIVVSHVRQARPVRERIEVWRSAVEALISNQPVERRFDLFDDGVLIPWEETSPSVWSRKPPVRRG